MKNRLLTMITLMFCIELLIPKAVFAFTKSYQYVDYRFTIQDEDGESIEGLTFNLYDESGLFHFESEYNEEEKYYYFDVYTEDIDISTSIPQEISAFNGEDNSMPNSCDVLKSNFDDIVGRYPSFSVGTKECLYDTYYNMYESTYSVNKIVPLVLEEESKNIKKIIFGYLHYNIYYANQASRYYKFILVNNESYKTKCEIEEQIQENWWSIDYYLYYLNDNRCHFFYVLDSTVIYFTPLPNYNEMLNNPNNQRVDGSLSFMRNAVYEYNDELWEELNNGPIASSEMSFDNSSVVIDSSDSGANISTPSIIRLKNKTNDSTNNNEDNNIINVITNPQTGIKGLLVLIISLITVIGTSLIIITKKNNKLSKN